MSSDNPRSEDKPVSVAPSRLEALLIAQKQIQAASREVESAKSALNEAARRYLMESSESELFDRAGYVYWELMDVPSSLIASVVVGDPKNVNKLLSLLPARILNTKCASCGGDIDIKSRAALKEAWRWGPPTCKSCQERAMLRRSDEYEAQREKDARRRQVLHTMPYREYLLTEEWLETRNRKLKQARFACQLCGSSESLNVHHRTYERRGYENMTDLIVLCHSCHAKFHGKLP